MKRIYSRLFLFLKIPFKYTVEEKGWPSEWTEQRMDGAKNKWSSNFFLSLSMCSKAFFFFFFDKPFSKPFLFFFCWVSVYAGARTPEVKVTSMTRYHLGQQARWSFSKPFDCTVSFLFYTKRLYNGVLALLNSIMFCFLIIMWLKIRWFFFSYMAAPP